MNNFFINSDNTIITNDLDEANFNNCIIFGNDNAEIDVFGEGDSDLFFKFTNCLIRYDVNSDPLDLDDPENFEDIELNDDPEFKFPFDNDLRLNENSPARNLGDPFFAGQVPFDIMNVLRTGGEIDLGAYQFVPEED